MAPWGRATPVQLLGLFWWRYHSKRGRGHGHHVGHHLVQEVVVGHEWTTTRYITESVFNRSRGIHVRIDKSGPMGVIGSFNDAAPEWYTGGYAQVAMQVAMLQQQYYSLFTDAPHKFKVRVGVALYGDSSY